MRRLPPAPRPAPTPRRVRLLVIVKIIAPLSTEALNICPRHVVMPTTRSYFQYDALLFKALLINQSMCHADVKVKINSEKSEIAFVLENGTMCITDS